MDRLILASGECDPSEEIICAPTNVNELFEFTHPLFSIGPFDVTRVVALTFIMMVIVLALFFFGLRRVRLVPTKFGLTIESIVQFIRNDVAEDVIGPGGSRFAPYLLAVFMTILVSNAFEVTPFINFPLTARMAIPIFLAVLTWVIFVVAGFAANGFSYLWGIVWPKSVPIALRPLVGLIEFFSVFLLRPITLAVRLFANLVAGHLMLTLLLVSGVVFISNIDEIGLKALVGGAWFAVGLGIFVFEIVVIVLQAYIFTLLAAVYIQTSLHPEH